MVPWSNGLNDGSFSHLTFLQGCEPSEGKCSTQTKGQWEQGHRRGAGARVGLPWVMPDSGFGGDAKFSKAQKVG